MSHWCQELERVANRALGDALGGILHFGSCSGVNSQGLMDDFRDVRSFGATEVRPRPLVKGRAQFFGLVEAGLI